jgi:dolichyl-phosphate beta-glucosyltransferase
LDAIAAFCELLDARPNLEMVFGARIRLLGRAIERKALRHYFGRVFATAASMVLGLSVHDMQCGAKLFRAMPAIKLLFLRPFAIRWLVDVELLARLIQARWGTPLPRPRRSSTSGRCLSGTTWWAPRSGHGMLPRVCAA